ncbi:helix-turn-helix domain-containing protein [Companilactobacillus kimchii]|uniref:HTH araC/xylS-type domain-containing protein n=2 Tax=Companilactobacillus kimchii TaxID=2801452 RepID=A0ABR5NVN2_9LACO|nr:AraC family transcriptional regulator [Companilactobacillus kimchii]KAE9559708.1 hypothetical protein ATN91_02635 [Companilactobacillus kimchii]KRK52956.1 hypothetical protein FC97_GL001747 [Companilactobacillus kimchii DSM 13961 = JCM 10707]OWF32091.1 Xylan 1,4-beta-xylosidase [Companilactobacillus kimchii]GEO47962.1 hypothetical protein LKI01_19610 [Companilactobacillus paralimentarius]
MLKNNNENRDNVQHELINLLPNIPFKIYMSDQHPKSTDHSYIVPHYHDDVEIIYLIKGNVKIFDNNSVTELNPGSVYIINSNDIHSTTSSSTHIQNYVLQISYDFLINFIPNFSTYHFMINNQHPAITQLKDDIVRMDFFLNKNHKANAYLSGLSSLFDLLYLLTTYFYTTLTSKSAAKNFKYHKRMGQAIGYIESNYSTPITLKEISNYIHLSPAYFSDFFKKQTGLTFYTYLTNVRMKHAEDYLKNTNIEIMQVIDNCGFSTYHQFRKEFYIRFNMSPSQFRKNSKKEGLL